MTGRHRSARSSARLLARVICLNLLSIQRGKHAVQEYSSYAVARVWHRGPDSYFVFSRVGAACPGHEKHAGNEDAADKSVAIGIAAEDGDEYARNAEADGISESASVSATEDGNEHANARRISRCIFSKDGNEYADDFCEPVRKSDGSNARHGHERNEYG